MQAIHSNTRRGWATSLVIAASLWLVTGLGAADAKPEAKPEGKSDAASTNKAPWEVPIPQSAFLDDRNKKEFKDPFFPSTTRRMTDAELKALEEKKKAEQAAAAAAAAAKAAADAAAKAGGGTPVQTQGTVPAPVAKWHDTFKLQGIVGSGASGVAAVFTGKFTYYFRQGQSHDVQTPGKVARVTCHKISADGVEIEMAGEKEKAVLR